MSGRDNIDDASDVLASLRGEVARLTADNALAEEGRKSAWVRADELHAERESLRLQLNKACAQLATVTGERDTFERACQQKHGVHPSWVLAATEARAQLAEARREVEALKTAAQLVATAHSAVETHWCVTHERNEPEGCGDCAVSRANATALQSDVDELIDLCNAPPAPSAPAESASEDKS